MDEMINARDSHGTRIEEAVDRAGRTIASTRSATSDYGIECELCADELRELSERVEEMADLDPEGIETHTWTTEMELIQSEAWAIEDRHYDEHEDN